MNEDTAYRAAFAYIVGAITAREQLNMPPLSAKQLFQQVYDSYGILPVDSMVEKLGLIVKEDNKEIINGRNSISC